MCRFYVQVQWQGLCAHILCIGNVQVQCPGFVHHQYLIKLNIQVQSSSLMCLIYLAYFRWCCFLTCINTYTLWQIGYLGSLILRFTMKWSFKFSIICLSTPIVLAFCRTFISPLSLLLGFCWFGGRNYACLALKFSPSLPGTSLSKLNKLGRPVWPVWSLIV